MILEKFVWSWKVYLIGQDSDKLIVTVNSSGVLSYWSLRFDSCSDGIHIEVSRGRNKLLTIDPSDNIITVTNDCRTLTIPLTKGNLFSYKLPGQSFFNSLCRNSKGDIIAHADMMDGNPFNTYGQIYMFFCFSWIIFLQICRNIIV